ncbi:MAG: hypothetical protein WBE45_10065 [Terriglobales bacterium]|jgi:hypothetical protein
MDSMNLWMLLLAAVTYPMLAHLDVARGQHVGEIVTEIQIDRTVYISPDWCADAKIGAAYPAYINKDHTSVQVRIGETVCKYHITSTRPFLRRSPPQQ